MTRKAKAVVDEDPWDVARTAAYLGLTVGRLYQLNSSGDGPKYFRTGPQKGRCWYLPQDVRDYRSERAVDAQSA